MSDLLYEQLNNMLTIHYNIKDIIITRKIGSGGYSKVMRGNYKSLPIAIKKLKEFDIKKFMKEIMIIKNFKHPKVPNFYGICKDIKTESMRLITELITGENFDTYVKNNKCSDIEILIYFIELAKILEYFHSYKFIHRDIKPSNIMIDNNLCVRLLDFGISKITNNTHTTTITSGTTIYMAPDNFQIKDNCTEEESRCSITTKVDVWAYGCILSEIFSKEKPWKRERDQHQVIAHLFNKSKFIIPEEKITNKEVISLIEDCTNVEPTKRVSIKEAKNKVMKILYVELFNGFKNDSDFIENLLRNLDSKKSINALLLGYLLLQKIYENLQYYYFSQLGHRTRKTSNQSKL